MTGPRPTRHPWSRSELDWLSEHYGRLGPSRAAQELGRSRRAVQGKAQDLGLMDSSRNPTRGTGRTEAHERELRRVYSGGRADPGTVAALAERWGVSETTVRRWARDLGLTRRRGAPGTGGRWTDEELAILEETAHLSPEATQQRLLRAGYHRTAAAILHRRWTEQVQPEDGGYYAASQAADLLGIADATLTAALDRGELPAVHRGEPQTHRSCSVRYVHRRDLARWVRDNPYRIDGTKVDMVWLIDLLTRPGRT